MPLHKLTLRIGFGAAIINIAGGIVYLVILAIIIGTSTSMLDAGAPPLVAVSTIMLIGPLGLIPLWVAIYLLTAEERKVYSLISLVFIVLLSATTSINRWVHLTVVRPALSVPAVQGLEWFTPYGPNSIMYAIELLAYGWFLGFALLALAFVFGGCKAGVERGLFWACLLSGVLCLMGALSRLTDISVLLVLGLLGWAFGLGIINVLLAVWLFRLVKNVPA